MFTLALGKGSLILADFTAIVKDSNEAYDTTIEADAKKYSIYDSDINYSPRVISIGEINFPVLKGLDNALLNSNVGDKLTVHITPGDGFGERNSSKIRMIPLRKLGDDAEKISPGDTIDVDGKRGIVRFIGSGRVRIDYNHRFAGKTIVYDIEIKKSLDADDDKINEILKYRLPVKETDISFKKYENNLDVTIPKDIFTFENLSMTKHIIQMDIFKFVSNLEKINFIETYQSSKPTQTESEQTSTTQTESEQTSTTQTESEQTSTTQTESKQTS